jgi:hypothetical protein
MLSGSQVNLNPRFFFNLLEGLEQTEALHTEKLSDTAEIHLMKNNSTGEYYIFELGGEYDDDYFYCFFTENEAVEYFETRLDQASTEL